MNWILIGMLFTTFIVLISPRMSARIQALALQGALLSALYIAVRGNFFDLHGILLVTITFVIKTLLIPFFLLSSFKGMSDKPMTAEPNVNFAVTLIGGCVITIISFMSAKFLPAINPALSSSLAVPAALASVMIGLWILVTKTKATNQVIGFLVLENGVFIFGMTIVSDFPMMVELGVLLDLLVGVFVMGIIVYHINKTFDHIDTRTLATLTDE